MVTINIELIDIITILIPVVIAVILWIAFEIIDLKQDINRLEFQRDFMENLADRYRKEYFQIKQEYDKLQTKEKDDGDT